MTKRKTNILFINPSSMPANEQEAFLNKTSILRVPSFSMPLGILEIVAYLQEHLDNINIKIVDMGKDLYKTYLEREQTPAMSLESFIELGLDSVDFQPDIVGISILFSSSHSSSKIIINKVKERWNDVVIICGGNHATNMVDNLLANPNIDYVLRGEGELSFTEFVRCFQRDENINVFGIIDKKKLKKSKNELSPLIMDLNDIPIPAYDFIDIETYRKTVGASLMFTRGCIFKCTFCASHTVHGRKVRYKSNDRILDELNLFVGKYNFDKIIIEDDLFAINKNKFLDLSKKIVSRNLSVKFYLPQGLSVATLDEDIIDAMIDMKICEAAVAIESGSPYTQKHLIKKNVDLTKARSILKYFRKKDFLISANFILGFPRETRELMRETIDYIKTIDVDWVYIFHALPLPGSEMFQEYVSKGIINPNTFDWDGIRLGRRSFDTPEISAKELESLVYDTNIDCNFFNNSNLRHKRYKRAIKVFNEIILDQYPFHIVGHYCRGLAFLGLGKKENAKNDFLECIRWIQKNEESKRLFERYGENMEYLHPYLEELEI